MSFPSRSQLDEYVASVEAYVTTSLQTARPDLDGITNALNDLWGALSRFGPPEFPSMPSLPGLGTYQVPLPPPPPPPTGFLHADSWLQWAKENKLLIGAGVVATGAGLGFGAMLIAQRRRAMRKRSAAALASSRTGRTVGSDASLRKFVVVVLGADTPLGLPLVAALEREGYIVIASVSSPDSVALTESIGDGYVRALVLDPSEPKSMPHFLRSLHATLALRFPLRAAGDPYRSGPVPAPRLLSTISLLALPQAQPQPAPFEHLDFQLEYLPHLTRTHVVPLQTVQALLPLFRMPSRGWGLDDGPALSQCENRGLSQSILLCVPAPDALVGVPYAAAQAMSAAATTRGAEVLRRELAQAARFAKRSPQNAEGGRQVVGNVRVVLIDVGTVGSPSAIPSPSLSAESNSDEDEAIRSWTATEQSMYGAPYVSYLSASRRGRARQPAATEEFVTSVIEAVGRNREKAWADAKLRVRSHGYVKGAVVMTRVGLRLWGGNVRAWWKGHRFTVGAGASTYAFASYLPTSLLDILLNLPAFLISVRNKYLPIVPHVLPPTVLLPEADVSAISDPLLTGEGAGFSTGLAHDESDDLIQLDEGEMAASASELEAADAQGGISDDSSSEPSVSYSGVENSWVSVQD